MKEILMVQVIEGGNYSRKETRKVDFTQEEPDEVSQYLIKLRGQMTRGLYFYTKKGELRWTSEPRSKRELRDIRKNYPYPEEMGETLKALNGRGKNITVYKDKGKIVDYKLGD
jgi:hypothetical protein